MEEFSRGAYEGLCGTGMVVNFKNAAVRPIGNMHFAGTETASRWSGYMCGAVEAGERAAKEILEKLNKVSS
jgi:monoamine oxidase